MDIKHLVWGYSTCPLHPEEYSYKSFEEILEINHNQFECTNIQTYSELVEPAKKQFTKKQLQQLIVARGFIEVVCNWVKPEQIQDPEIQARVAFIQHFLDEIWEKLENEPAE